MTVEPGGTVYDIHCVVPTPEPLNFNLIAVPFCGAGLVERSRKRAVSPSSISSDTASTVTTWSLDSSSSMVVVYVGLPSTVTPAGSFDASRVRTMVSSGSTRSSLTKMMSKESLVCPAFRTGGTLK